MFKAGMSILTKVTRSALQNPASISGLMLTTEACHEHQKEDEEDSAGPHRRCCS